MRIKRAAFTCGGGWWTTSGTMRGDEVHVYRERGDGSATVKFLTRFEGHAGETLGVKEFLDHPERAHGLRPVLRRATGIDRLGIVVEAMSPPEDRQRMEVPVEHVRPGDLLVENPGTGAQSETEVLKVSRPPKKVRLRVLAGVQDYVPGKRVVVMR